MLVRAADIHAGAHADGFEAFENADRGCAIIVAGRFRRRRRRGRRQGADTGCGRAGAACAATTSVCPAALSAASGAMLAKKIVRIIHRAVSEFLVWCSSLVFAARLGSHINQARIVSQMFSCLVAQRPSPGNRESWPRNCVSPRLVGKMRRVREFLRWDVCPQFIWF